MQSNIDDALYELDELDPKAADLAGKIAYGESYPLERDIEAWLASLEVEPKTKDMRRGDVRRFIEKFPFSHEVTKSALTMWAHSLQTLSDLKPTTVRRVLSACRGYWQYLHACGHLIGMETVFDRVAPKKVARAKLISKDVRQAFLGSDLAKLLASALDKGDKQLAQLIWMGMWTGCRIEELCSLRCDDVHAGYFEVRDAKTAAGERMVPIHPRLVPVINHLKTNSQDGFILSGLTFNKYGDRSNAIGKRFGRLKDSLGFDQRFVFHSIRKTVTTELENAGVPENVAADIVGHEKKTLTYGLYSGGNRLDRLQTSIRKLQFRVEPHLEKRLIY